MIDFLSEFDMQIIRDCDDHENGGKDIPGWEFSYRDMVCEYPELTKKEKENLKSVICDVYEAIEKSGTLYISGIPYDTDKDPGALRDYMTTYLFNNLWSSEVSLIVSVNNPTSFINKLCESISNVHQIDFPTDRLYITPDSDSRVRTFENIPDYAVSYMCDGDASDLTEEDVKNIDSFMKKNKLSHLVDFKETGFSSSPEFGLACNCVSANFMFNDEPSHDKKRMFSNTWFEIGEGIDFNDLRQVDCTKYPYAVTCTDKYFSNWDYSPTAGKNAKYIQLCTDREMAERMVSYARSRSEQKNISYCHTKYIPSSYFNNAHVRLCLPSNMSAWTEDYRRSIASHHTSPYSEKALKVNMRKLQMNLDDFDRKNSPVLNIERMTKLFCIENNLVWDKNKIAFVKNKEDQHPYQIFGFDKDEYKDIVKTLYKSKLNNEPNKINRLPSILACADKARIFFDSNELSSQMYAAGLVSKKTFGAFLKECAYEVFDKYYEKSAADRLKNLFEVSLKPAKEKTKSKDKDETKSR